eukprot:2603408-Ditylum_brightwellii.AAC.1
MSSEGDSMGSNDLVGKNDPKNDQMKSTDKTANDVGDEVTCDESPPSQAIVSSSLKNDEIDSLLISEKAKSLSPLLHQRSSLSSSTINEMYGHYQQENKLCEKDSSLSKAKLWMEAH